MIRNFLGMPGEGKSYGAMRDIVEELVRGQRIVVTNLPVLRGELNAWLQLNHNWDGDINLRFRRLSDAETKTFYLHRWHDRSLDPLDEARWKQREYPAFSQPGHPGCLFVIDEAHIFFDSREWAESGLLLTYYNSQHRKFNDEVIFVTQFLELMDKRVREFANEYHYFANLGTRHFATVFRLPRYFTVSVYRKKYAKGDVAEAVHRYRMDFTLAKCYDTSSGVGISGRKMPERKRIKGIAIWWLGVPIAIFAYAMFKAPDVVSSAVVGAINDTMPTKGQDGAGQHGVPTAPPPGGHGGFPVFGMTPRGAASDLTGLPVPPIKEVFVRSYAVRGRSAVVTLTDGRILANREIREINGRYVVLADGSKFYMMRPLVPPRNPVAIASVTPSPTAPAQ